MREVSVAGHGRLALVIGIGVLIAGCVGTGPGSATPASTGQALRTFPVYGSTAGAQVACPAFAVTPDVVGALAGSASDPELVWLTASAGTRMSVVWPAGYRVAFGPDAAIYDAEGKLFARAGDTIRLGQVRLGDFAGTPSDPYPAAGLIDATGPNGTGEQRCVVPAEDSRYAVGVPSNAGVLQIDAADQVQAAPSTEVGKQAFDAALRFAMANPDDVGYPWIDPDATELVVSAATPKGRSLLQTRFIGGSLAIATQVRDVKYSYTQLQHIQDDVTYLASRGVADADLIYQTGPDQRDDLALITISRSDPPLVAELARLYGADAIAVRIRPR
jgi:hypothetical protein